MRRHSSHKPYTTAVSIKLISFRKKEFRGWLWIFKHYFCNFKRGWIFWLVPAKWIDVDYFVFFNIDDIALKMNPVRHKEVYKLHFSFQEVLSIFQNMGGQHHRLGISMTWFLLNLNLVWTVNDQRWMYLLVRF